MTRWRIGSIAGALTLTMASAVGAEIGSAMLLKSLTWPGMSTVWQHQTMYLTSEPSREGLQYAKKQGVTTVINLMMPSEQHWNEADAVKFLGLRYINAPIAVEQPNEAVVGKFLQIVKDINAKQVLIHCDVAGRALAMWAIYLGTAEGYTPEQALAQAEKAGLKHAGLRRFVLSYLKRQPAHA